MLGLACAVFAFAVGGCAILEKETTNRGGYLDYVVDQHWLKADSKRMRALRALAIQVSLARIASVSAKNDSDRQLLAIRIGALSKRFIPIRDCAFNLNPLGVAGAEKDPCFYYDSAMVEYSTGLFDLAMIALPIEDARRLVNTVTGSFVNPINVVDLLDTLLTIGRDALKYGRIVGALYRDTVELEVQLWLATPAIDDRPFPYRVTETHVAALREIYDRGNDDMPAWLAAIAALRAQGLEPLPHPKFFNELGGLMRYVCDLITKDPDASKTCKDGLPTTLPAPAPVLKPLPVSSVTTIPGIRSTPGGNVSHPAGPGTGVLANDATHVELMGLLYPQGPLKPDGTRNDMQFKAVVGSVLGNDAVKIGTIINNAKYSQLRRDLINCIKNKDTIPCAPNSLENRL
jgi:hypothetical protein